MMSLNINTTAVSNICSFDYRCIINGISKSEATNLLQNSDLCKKKKEKRNIIKCNFRLLCIKQWYINYKVW